MASSSPLEFPAAWMESVRVCVLASLKEDLGGGPVNGGRADVTARLVPEDKVARAKVITR